MRPFVCLSLALSVLLGLSGSVEAAESRVVLFAGGDSAGDGPATQAKLVAPFGVDFDRSGNTYIVELTGERVLRVDREGQLTRIAGSERKKGNTGDGGPAMEATFNAMHSVAIGRDGLVYLADTLNNRVRRLDPQSGRIEAFAGTGAKGDEGDGIPALKAKFGGIYCIAFDPRGVRLILTDLDMRRIRSVDMKTGIVRTVAGNGKRGVPEDGADARSAPLVDPRAACADAEGNVYILERSGHALRVVDVGGKIRTVVGTGEKGVSLDGGDARSVKLNGPKHLCLDQDGSVLIADTENHLILRYRPREGKVERVAGSGKKGTGGVGGPPEKVELNQPHGVLVHPSGAIYVTDSSNNRVLRIER